MIWARCGECREKLWSEQAQGLFDAIRLHCREYHPTWGNGGQAFDRLDPKLLELGRE